MASRFALRAPQLARSAFAARSFASSSRILAQASASVVPADVVPLTDAHKAAVSATAPILAEHGFTITTEMYRTMLGNNPDLLNIFSVPAQKTGVQPKALADSVYAYAANINDLTPLVPTVIRIAEKHAALGVKPEHYVTVGTNLLQAITTVLGDAFTPELKEAWYQAYWQLAKIFIDAEADLYSKAAWDGWAKFKVENRVNESGEITSFVLVPVDPAMLPIKPYKPGQFITARVWVDELKCYQNRHYSISDAHSPDHYRLTIKREEGSGPNIPDGLVSTRMHSLQAGDIIDCSFPVGSFTLPEVLPKNIVMFSGGVGITPNLAMLNSLVGVEDLPNISWIQACRTEADHVFKQHVAKLAEESNGKIRTATYYSLLNKHHTEKVGFVEVDKMDKGLLALDDPKTVYYVCGPDPFMALVTDGLQKLGIDKSNIHLEAFHAGEV